MLEIGSLLDDKYRILREVGRGGMSVVYLALVERANKTWAVKEVRKKGESENDEIVKQGLLAETDILKRLNHPNLPSIIDVIDKEDTFIIVMDYIEGLSLSEVLADEGAQSQDAVIKWAKQLTDVLGYLHSREPAIIYRDMKPANIMLRPDGNITLIDFGTAREYKEKNLADTTYLGTIGYAAPEQFGGQGQTDARTDIYNLGATLYQLITDKNPSEPPYTIRPIREINPQLSPGLEMIISKCTEPNPDDRYQNAAELMYALENYETIDVRHKKRERNKLIGFIASGVMTIALGAGTLMAYNGAQGVKGEMYHTLVAKASDMTLTPKESVDLYLEAIAIDASDKNSYKKMIDVLINYDLARQEPMSATDIDYDALTLTAEEAAVFTRLDAGLSRKRQSNVTELVYPLQELQAANNDDYQEVIYLIANSFWYEYEVENARESAAVEWFELCTEKYPISNIYMKIGQTKAEIKRSRKQNRTVKMYEAYQELWETQKDLFKGAEEVNHNDTSLLVWPEIVKTINTEAQPLVTSGSSQEIYDLLDTIRQSAEKLRDTSQIVEIKDRLDTLLDEIEIAKKRVDVAVEQNEVINQGEEK